MRSLSDLNILSKFCVDFCKVVSKHAEYIVVSGFVAIASGRTRGTEDIDMIIERLDKAKFVKLHDELVKNGFVCMQSDDEETIYSDYLSHNDSVRYTWKNKPLPEIEVKFAKDSLDDYQLKTKTKLKLTGLDIFFSSVNMNIAFKEELLKSDKDLEDSRHLRIVFSELVDEEEIRMIKKMIRKARLK